MNYYRALKDISAWVPKDAEITGKGANTMDIGRTQLPNVAPWLRLSAGSYGTMRIGIAFAIAAAVVHPDRPIVSVSGDSAMGFSGMEMETACRYNLPVKIVVLNHGGIGGGIAEFSDDRGQLPPRVLTIGARYDKMMEAFRGPGWYIEDSKDLRGALDEAMAFKAPALVNVRLHHAAGRKPQQFGWHTS